jgi:hypothetical protein
VAASSAATVLDVLSFVLPCLAGLQVAGLHELLLGEAEQELAAMAEEELDALQSQVGAGWGRAGCRGEGGRGAQAHRSSTISSTHNMCPNSSQGLAAAAAAAAAAAVPV